MRLIVPFPLVPLLAAASFAVASPAPARAAAAQDTLALSPITHVVVLGMGSPLISATRSGTSVAVTVRGVAYIFDAGPGVIRRIFEAREKHIALDTIAALFITHLHSDHTLGIPELMYYHGRGPLTVYGPVGTQAMLGHLQAAWAPDVDIRTRANADVDPRVFEVHTTDVTGPGVVYRDSNVVVKAFEVPHTIWPHALAYRVEAPDRTIVISGDERPNDTIVKACSGCDILLHEVYDVERFARIPSQNGRNYHQFSHTSTLDLGDIATKAHPKLLVLYHQLYFGGTDADLLRQIATRYRGRVVSAHDLDVF